MKTLSLVCLTLILAASAAFADSPKNSQGTISALTVINLDVRHGLSKAEKEYPVNATLSSQPKIVFGFKTLNDGNLSKIDAAMFELLKIAFDKGWPVKLRWVTDMVYQKSKGPTRARILGVTVGR